MCYTIKRLVENFFKGYVINIMRNILKLYVANLAKIFLELLPAILSWSEKVEIMYTDWAIELMRKFRFCKIQANFDEKGVSP